MGKKDHRRLVNNRRRHPRVSTDMKILFTIENDPDSQNTYQGDVMEVSQGGMRFKTGCRLWRDAEILFTIKDLEERTIISGIARILNIYGEVGDQIVGAEFTEFIMFDAA